MWDGVYGDGVCVRVECVWDGVCVGWSVWRWSVCGMECMEMECVEWSACGMECMEMECVEWTV